MATSGSAMPCRRPGTHAGQARPAAASRPAPSSAAYADQGHGAVPAGHEHEITLKGLFLFPLPVEADADPDAEKRE